MAYNEQGVRAMANRAARRRELSLEERQTEALEQIADTLYAIEDALDRIADNG